MSTHALAFDGDVAGVGREQAQDQAREGGLAAARFAHDAQHAARRHGEGDVVDGHDMAVLAEHAALDAEGLARRDFSSIAGRCVMSWRQPAEIVVARRRAT